MKRYSRVLCVPLEQYCIVIRIKQYKKKKVQEVEFTGWAAVSGYDSRVVVLLEFVFVENGWW